MREGSTAEGTSAMSLRLRSETGALVLGIRRGDVLMQAPDPARPHGAGAIVYPGGGSGGGPRALAWVGPAGARAEEAEAEA